MFNWLVTHATLLYVLLGVPLAGLVMGLLTIRQRKTKELLRWQRPAFLGLLLIASLLAALVVIDRSYETDERQIVRKINEMADGVKTRNFDRVIQNFAKDFRFGGLDTAGFRQRTEAAVQTHNLTDVVVWDFLTESLSRDKGIAKVLFKAKPHGNWGGEMFYDVEAVFVLEDGNQWRLKTFEIFFPREIGKNPVPIPGF